MSAYVTFVGRKPIDFLAQFLTWWRRFERRQKFAAAVSVSVVCSVVYVCSFLGTYIEEAFGNKAAASTALYMDSFIEPLVQTLGQSSSLSPQTRAALERLLSPASIGKPVVAFRIWVGDRIVFSNRSELVGRSFPPSAARSSARQGEVVATFGPDSDDDEYERSLGVPTLEIHAPIRKAGTHEIIAIAETAELASKVTSQIRAAQYTSYAVIVSLATVVLLTLFGFGSSRDGMDERIVAMDALASRLCAASGHVLEASDRDRRTLCEELHAGPLQHAAFALLRVEELREAGERPDTEIEIVSQALETCVAQLRALSGSLPPEFTDVPVATVCNMAISQHVLKTGHPVEFDLTELPQNVPYALKACLFHLLAESLHDSTKYAQESKIQICARRKEEGFEIGVYCETNRHTVDGLVAELSRGSQNLRSRVESVRGELVFESVPSGVVSITANFVLPTKWGEDV
jgi:signal transduction histidine kinase